MIKKVLPIIMLILLALPITVLANGDEEECCEHMFGMFGFDGMGMWGIGGSIMLIIWIIIIIAVIAVILALVKGQAGQGQNSKTESNALNILKERYAKGDINKKEFEEKKKDLN